MTIPINQKEYTVILSDTAGQEEFDKLRQLAYRDVSTYELLSVCIMNRSCNVSDGRLHIVLRRQSSNLVRERKREMGAGIATILSAGQTDISRFVKSK